MTTYYVSTTGNDNGSGTQSSPWHTINHALQSSLKPGDTVVVAPGTYNEAIDINTGGSAAGNITLQSQVPGALSSAHPRARITPSTSTPTTSRSMASTSRAAAATGSRGTASTT
jgi:hypothetical protein